MTDEVTRLRATLDALATGDLDAREARKAVRQAFQARPEGVDYAYAALQRAAWWIVRLDRMPDDIAEWHDLFKHASALARNARRDEMAERFHALAGLVWQTADFHNRHRLEEVLSRRYVLDILGELAHRDGNADRPSLAAATGLSEWNLSKAVFILEALGLVRRLHYGSKGLELTENGRRAASGAAVQRGSDDKTDRSPDPGIG